MEITCTVFSVSKLAEVWWKQKDLIKRRKHVKMWERRKVVTEWLKLMLLYNKSLAVQWKSCLFQQLYAFKQVILAVVLFLSNNSWNRSRAMYIQKFFNFTTQCIVFNVEFFFFFLGDPSVFIISGTDFSCCIGQFEIIIIMPHSCAVYCNR